MKLNTYYAEVCEYLARALSRAIPPFLFILGIKPILLKELSVYVSITTFGVLA